MTIVAIIFLSIYSLIAIMMCHQESQKRKINFYLALLICVVATPLFGYYIISGMALRNPQGCKWCGNAENESEYCGLCHLNEAGKTEQETKVS